jgi:hypothetical protein
MKSITGTGFPFQRDHRTVIDTAAGHGKVQHRRRVIIRIRRLFLIVFSADGINVQQINTYISGNINIRIRICFCDRSQNRIFTNAYGSCVFLSKCGKADPRMQVIKNRTAVSAGIACRITGIACPVIPLKIVF